MSFHSLALPEALLQALDQLQYTQPTPIQTQAIPVVLAGQDVLGQSQTGTGKTAAFALPLLARMADRTRRNYAHALVLTPTRELALQVGEAFKRYGNFMRHRPKVHILIGGEDSLLQLEALEWGADVLVATPGRLLDLLGQEPILLKAVEALVLDEADKMVSLGFIDELNAILAHLPGVQDAQNTSASAPQPHLQTLLFSATFPEKVQDLALKTLKDPVEIRVADTPVDTQNITQRAIAVDRQRRGQLLRHLCQQENWERTLVFVASKRSAANLAAKLNKADISALAFHGNLSQPARMETLRRFENREAKVLIATDIAARGLDFEDLSHVVNFDLPRSPADYIHRIGRTARAGKTGTAIAFIDEESHAHFKLIEKRARIQLEREHIPGFEPLEAPVIPKKGKPPVKGKRMSKKDKLRLLSEGK